MDSIPVFPLGSVLLPGMPTVLRVFEERYLVMLADVLSREPAQFGIVLIERGAEVGGGDRRFTVGTIAEVTQLMEGEGFVGLVAQGIERFEIVDWREDDPYPRADVRRMPELEWDEVHRARLDETERVVRRALAQGSEFVEQRWSTDTELAEDPVAASWQLAGIAPIEEFDRYALLRSTTVQELLERTATLAAESVETLTLRFQDDELELGDDPRDE